MTETNEWVLATQESGFRRQFDAAALPVRFGGGDDDIRLAGIQESVQIGLLDDIFFVQPRKNSRNVRLSGELLQGSRRLDDGDVIAIDTARLECRISGGKLTVDIKAQVTAGDTAPPDLADVARGSGPRRDDEFEVTPVSFSAGQSADGMHTKHAPSKAAWITGIAFGLLAVLGWFAFTAKSVEIVIEPSPTDMRLADTLFKIQLGDRFLLRSGRHKVEAELEGYYPLNTVVDVGQSPDQSVVLAMTRLPGLITLRTGPEVNADVLLDGESLGRTPLVDVEIVPGEHELEFAAPRFIPMTRALSVAGGHEKQALSVTLTPNWAPVTLVTEPPGAEVFVDGQLRGATPIRLELDAGERALEARLAGHNAWRGTVRVEPDVAQDLPSVVLSPADGRVELLSTPSEASVNVNGEFRGRTPLRLRLTPGRNHEIVLTKPGYEDFVRELSVAADSGRQLAIELTAQYGEVEIQSEPANAEIWVDGRRAGNTPSTLRLTALDHRIEVRQPGFATRSAEITPRPGFSQTLAFVLEALDDSTGSGYPRVLRTTLGQELRLVPAGRFAMGSSRREQGRRSNEVLREVELSRAFYLGTREVTNAEFRAFNSDHDSGDFGSESLNGDDQPVVRVTWDEVAQFLNWLSIEDALQPVYEETPAGWAAMQPLRSGYRLPTEAEWAYAARAAGLDEELIYPWGQMLPPPDRSGNYADLSAGDLLPTTLVTYNDGFPVSAPVGSFAPNAVGIYDLGGNAAEWVQDVYVIDVAPAGELLVDPLGPAAGRSHVVRGASWRSYLQTDLRLASRDYSTDRREDLGFRIARNLE
jgi:formylglycine-generating enzyme required for sulfatase activity